MSHNKDLLARQIWRIIILFDEKKMADIYDKAAPYIARVLVVIVILLFAFILYQTNKNTVDRLETVDEQIKNPM